MVRSQIYFKEEQYETLRKLSFKEHVSISEMVRRFVGNQITSKKTPKRKKSAAAVLLSLAGLCHETKKDVAERHDDYLWGEES